MEKEHELEWNEAQNIVISEDLLAVAKRQLQFLSAIDRNRWLYEGPALQKAIHRYNAFWLPLLARYSEAQVSEGPLVVPLDCEWVWHCHRLNPIRYKSDCEEFYGRSLDNKNVVSSLQGISKGQTEEIWNNLYPEEPYDIDLTKAFSNDISESLYEAEKHAKYNLVSAVERQGPFFYQVSRPHMNDDLFLEEAVARYKGFLHLIRRNRERSLRRFCVPTYDIDLIWHSHMLNPVSYCNDLVELLGKVMGHDDTDSDRTKGSKLYTGSSETTKQWEETFGSRYWRAGAMYRGTAPSPLSTNPLTPSAVIKKVNPSNGYEKIMDLPEAMIVEVLLEFVEIRNLPEEYKGSVSVLFTKTPQDAIFTVKTGLTIFSESGQKQVALFQCQPTGYLFFELIFQAPSNLPISKPSKILASSFISLYEFQAPVSKLSVDKWLDLVPSSGTIGFQSVSLHVAASFTIPVRAPHVLKMVHSRPFLKGSCFFPLAGKKQFAKSWTRVTDETGNEVISLQMREFSKAKGVDDQMMGKEVIGITRSGEMFTFAQYSGREWSLIDSQWSLKLKKESDNDSHLELTGHQMVKLVPGRKLEFQPKHCEKQRDEDDFMTAIEFSPENPYGRAIALLDLKTGLFKVHENWLALPGITLAFIISHTLRKEGYEGLSYNGESLKASGPLIEETNGYEAAKITQLTSSAENYQNVNMVVAVCGIQLECVSCGGGCGGGCGNTLKSDGFANCSFCGMCLGNTMKSGGCGSSGGCGGSCGNNMAHGNVSGGPTIDEQLKQVAVQAN